MGGGLINTPNINFTYGSKDTFTLNGGCKEPSVGKQILGGAFGILGGVVNTAIVASIQGGGASKEVSAEAAAKVAAAEFAAQCEADVLNFARTMSISDLQAKVSDIGGDISRLATQKSELDDLAKGEESKDYKNNQTQIKNMENEYGFGTSVEKGKTPTNGQKYEQLATVYDKLVEQKNTYESNKIEYQNQIDSLTSQIEMVDGQIATQEKLIANMKKPDENNPGAMSLYNDQQSAANIKLNNLKTQLGELKKQKAGAEGDQASNEANKVDDKAIADAKSAMNEAASVDSNKGINYQSLYKTYKSLVDQNKKILSTAKDNANKADLLDNEIATKRLEQEKYSKAIELKGNMVNNDSKAINGDPDKGTKGFDNGKADGNWFSRTFGWGKKGKEKRAQHKLNNQYVNQYVEDHGVSKRKAKKEINAFKNAFGVKSG